MSPDARSASDSKPRENFKKPFCGTRPPLGVQRQRLPAREPQPLAWHHGHVDDGNSGCEPLDLGRINGHARICSTMVPVAGNCQVAMSLSVSTWNASLPIAGVSQICFGPDSCSRRRFIGPCKPLTPSTTRKRHTPPLRQERSCDLLLGFFLMASQVFRFHLTMASSLRSSARPAGRWDSS